MFNRSWRFVFSLLWLFSTANFALADAKSMPVSGINEQLQLIDLEILMLRAELAQKNGLPKVVEGYVQNIEKTANPAGLPATFSERLAYLKKYLELTSKPEQEGEIPFTFNTKNIVVLLPLTGDFGKAGQSILEGIQSELPNLPLQIIDTSIYDNAFELWELVKLYQPSFVFGPLRPAMAQGLADISPQVPMLMFNQVVSDSSAIKSLAPSRRQDAEALLKQVIKQNYRSVFVIKGADPKSQQLADHFYQAWSKLPDEERFRLKLQTVKSSVDALIYKELGAFQSKGRSSWLQKTIQESLETLPRARKDLDAVITIAPFRIAMQVSPLLSYYNLRQVSHIWLPASLPTVEVFSRNLSFWQDTQAILPFYQSQKILAYLHAFEDPEEVGIFYALGQTGVKQVKQMAVSSHGRMLTPLGLIELTPEGNIMIKPEYYWLNNGDMTRMNLP